MTASAREQLVAPFPSGTREQDGSSPPSAPFLTADFAARAANESGHARRPFLHILVDDISGALQTVPIDPIGTPAIPAEFTVDLLDRTAVSGTVLARNARDAGEPYLSEISFEGTSFAVPKARSLQVPGNFGMLSVNSSGAFSYTRAEAAHGFVDAFICTARAPGVSSPVRIKLEILSSR